MAGYPITKDILNSRVGYLVTTLSQVLDGFEVLKEFCDANQAADFGLGMAEVDVTQVRAIAAAMSNLSAIAHGQGTQPAANDFFWDTKHPAFVTGLD